MRRLRNKITLFIFAVITVCCACLFGIAMIASFLPESSPTAKDQAAPIQVKIPVSTNTAVAIDFIATLTPHIPTITHTLTPATLATANLGSPASCVPAQQPEIGIVADVVDGDTIKVIVNGATYNLRYIGIDTPENTTKQEYYGAEATAQNTQMVLGKIVTLYKDVSDTDRYGRLLRYVFVDNQFINLILVQEGYASAYRYEPDIACAAAFSSAKESSKFAQTGMWGGADSTSAPLATSPSTTLATSTSTPLATQTKPATDYDWQPTSYDNNRDGKVTCADFRTQAAAQKAYNAGYTKLDGNDNDGRACESLP